jgi:hypothetical protein
MFVKQLYTTLYNKFHSKYKLYHFNLKISQYNKIFFEEKIVKNEGCIDIQTEAFDNF